MTLQEFKAWFEGFTENISDKTPTGKQWKRICERVKEIDGTATTYPVFIDRWRPYQSYWGSPFLSNTVAGSAVGLANGGQAFNNIEAMMYAGRAEAQSLTA